MAKFLGQDEDYQLIQQREPRLWPRLRTGAGSIEGLPEVMASFRGDFTWLLCDPGLYQAGHAQKALSLIQEKFLSKEYSTYREAQIQLVVHNNFKNFTKYKEPYVHNL